MEKIKVINFKHLSEFIKKLSREDRISFEWRYRPSLLERSNKIEKNEVQKLLNITQKIFIKIEKIFNFQRLRWHSGSSLFEAKGKKIFERNAMGEINYDNNIMTNRFPYIVIGSISKSDLIFDENRNWKNQFHIGYASENEKDFRDTIININEKDIKFKSLHYFMYINKIKVLFTIKINDDLYIIDHFNNIIKKKSILNIKLKEIR